MSINGVFRTSVSGMNAQANRLSVVSDNIANANTNGYKRSDMEFSSLVLAQGGGEYNSGAVQTQVRQAISQQGSISASSSSTDLAIQGNGFFIVQDASGREFFTRAGSFVQRTETDPNGKPVTYLVNAAGYYLKDTTATQGSTGPITLPVGDIVNPKPTNAIDFSLQFPTTATAIADPTKAASSNALDATYTKKTSVVVYDGVGKARTLDVYFTKTEDSPPKDYTKWDVAVYDRSQATDGGFPYTETSPETLVQKSTTVSFDPTTGQPVDPATGNPKALADLPITLADGTNASISFSSLTEYATDFSARLTANGNPAGTFSDFSFSPDGTLNGIMDTGNVVPLYKLQLASFRSPDQLAVAPGNVYSATTTSGAVQIGDAGSSGFGSLVSSALEQSNVDMAGELTTMIEAQRSYSANSKVFQTGAEILDVLVNLKR